MMELRKGLNFVILILIGIQIEILFKVTLILEINTTQINIQIGILITNVTNLYNPERVLQEDV